MTEETVQTNLFEVPARKLTLKKRGGKYTDGNNTKTLKVTVAWKSDSTVSLSDDVLVTIGVTNFIYTQA